MASLMELLGDLNELYEEYISLFWIVICLIYVLAVCRRKKKVDAPVGESERPQDPKLIPNSDIPKNLLRPKKSMLTAYLYFFSFGFMNGAHHLYLESPVYAYTHMCTLGFCGYGILADLFLLPFYTWRYNRRHTHAEFSVHDNSFRRIVVNILCVPLVLCLCLGGVFFGVPPMYEYATNTYLGEGKVDRNPYEVLGIPNNSNMDQVKGAFRKLSMKYHPDKNRGKEEEVKEVMAELNSAMDRIKKGASHTWAGAEDGVLSEQYINTVANKWNVIVQDLQVFVTAKQGEYQKNFKQKSKLKTKLKKTRKANEVFSEDVTTGVDVVAEMLIGRPIFETLDDGSKATTGTSSSSTSNTSGSNKNTGSSSEKKSAKTTQSKEKTKLEELKEQLGDMAHLMSDEVLDALLKSSDLKDDEDDLDL